MNRFSQLGNKNHSHQLFSANDFVYFMFQNNSFMWMLKTILRIVVFDIVNCKEKKCYLQTSTGLFVRIQCILKQLVFLRLRQAMLARALMKLKFLCFSVIVCLLISYSLLIDQVNYEDVSIQNDAVQSKTKMRIENFSLLGLLKGRMNCIVHNNLFYDDPH